MDTKIDEPNPPCQVCDHGARDHGVAVRAPDGTPTATVCWVDRCHCTTFQRAQPIFVGLRLLSGLRADRSYEVNRNVTVYACDRCHVEAEVAANEPAPRGWQRVNTEPMNGDLEALAPSWDLCPTCFTKHLVRTLEPLNR